MKLQLWTVLTTLLLGQTAANKISPVAKEVRGTEGESVTLRCNYETTYRDIDLNWYRHHSDLQAPQFILWKGARERNGQEYIPDKRYGSRTTDSSTELTITKLTLADTALYYCALVMADLDSYALTFGEGIQLTVEPKDKTPVPPTMFVLNPLQPNGVSLDEAKDQVCLAAGFRPKEGNIVMTTKGQQVTTPTPTTTAALSVGQSTYYTAAHTNGSIDRCELHGSLSTDDDPCTDIQPEKSRLSFLMLLMNGVRLVFTKAVAFSTLLTVRAVLA